MTNAVENLGEVLHGSVIQNSAYEIFMGKSDFKVLCRVELTKGTAGLLAKRIKEDYRVHLIMDKCATPPLLLRRCFAFAAAAACLRCSCPRRYF